MYIYIYVVIYIYIQGACIGGRPAARALEEEEEEGEAEPLLADVQKIVTRIKKEEKELIKMLEENGVFCVCVCVCVCVCACVCVCVCVCMYIYTYIHIL